MLKKLSIPLLVTLTILLGNLSVEANSSTRRVEEELTNLNQEFSQLIAQETEAEEETESKTATITKEDLPDGFQELPPLLADRIKAQFEAISSQFRQGGLEPEEMFVYYHPSSLQVVAGFTGAITNEADFDGVLDTFSQPEVQEMMFAEIQKQLEDVDMVEISDYRPLTGMNDLGNKSFGLQLDAKVKTGFFTVPLTADVASFRREETGAFTMVMYRNSSTPRVSLRELSDTLDGKILD